MGEYCRGGGHEHDRRTAGCEEYSGHGRGRPGGERWGRKDQHDVVGDRSGGGRGGGRLQGQQGQAGGQVQKARVQGHGRGGVRYGGAQGVAAQEGPGRVRALVETNARQAVQSRAISRQLVPLGVPPWRAVMSWWRTRARVT